MNLFEKRHRRDNRLRWCALWLCLVCGSAVAQPESDALERWRGGDAIVLMRHALAPGTGDPADFSREDCTTQRNLSAAGRQQARDIGERLKAALGELDADVFSSDWCRCRQTARLLGLGDETHLAALDSFFQQRSRADSSTTALADWLDSRFAQPARPAVLVTHQVNITALTGAFAGSGDMLLIAPDESAPNGYGVLASIETQVTR